MQTVTKTIIPTVMLLISLVLASNVEARLKYYRYNANIPMVEMSLNMMVAMGVLEQIPGRLVHDGNPYNRSVSARHGRYSRYSRHSYDYPLTTRYSDDYLDDYLSDDYWGGPISPYSRYSDELYGYSSYPRYRSRGSRWDSPWGSRWGNRWDDPRYGGWGNQQYSPWGNAWKYQMMNPWSSPWADTLVNPYSGLYGNLGGLPLTPGYQGLPSSPDSMFSDNQPGNDSSNSGGPALKQPGNKNGYSVDEISWSGYPSSTGFRRSAHAANSRSPYQGINGLWIGESGEMLGLRGNNFLWYDGNEQYAIGDLLKSPTMMQASADGSGKVFRFHYKLMGNQLVTISKSGKISTYNRMPLMQPHQFSTRPHTSYSSYKPEQHASRASYSRYRPDYYGPGTAAALNSYPVNVSASAATNSLANNRRYGSAIAAADLYSRESPNLHQLAVTATDHRLQQDSSAASKLTGKGNLTDASAFSYRDVNTAAVPEVTTDSADITSLWNTYSPESNHGLYANSTTTGSFKDRPYKQEPVTSRSYHNADGNGSIVTDNSAGVDAGRNLQAPYTTYGAYPAFPTAAPGYEHYNAATVIPGSSTVSGSLLPSVAYTEGTSYLNRQDKYKSDELNPDTYLYSYMKDQNNVRTTAALEAADSFNIWKPNNSFGQRQHNSSTQQSSGSGQNTQQGITEVRKFVWSDSAAWN